MEELLWRHSDKFLNEPLTQFRRQPRSSVGRADLVFTDRRDRILVIELKKGVLPRGAIDQLLDYFGMLKREFPDKPVELMVVANSIPRERALACLKFDIEPREISEKKFRDVAQEVGFQFESESASRQLPEEERLPSHQHGSTEAKAGPRKVEKGWYYFKGPDQKATFLAFVNQKGSCSMRTFDAADGAFLGRQYSSGDYQDAFRDYIAGAQALSISKQPNLQETCRYQLPSFVLAELQRQVRN